MALTYRQNLAQEILALTNEYRRENGLEPLRRHKGLEGVAFRHATAMSFARAPFSHHGAPERFAACGTRCTNVAENLARSEGFGRACLPEAAVTGWRESEGHRRNLLGPFDACGIGFAVADNGVVFITQLFALLDEQDSYRGELRERAADIATANSTPAFCAAIGLVFGGPMAALGGGLFGKALNWRFGISASSMPRLLHHRLCRKLLPRRGCARCGTITEKGLLMEEATGAGKLLCELCHPSPRDDELWCYIDG
mmetsp:Transcript_68198/g.121585  ORF Transcript_68198/g.121585 Transcript_68198/m.121585 type:complete len:255 (+) Transcript_68198:93-857(+)